MAVLTEHIQNKVFQNGDGIILLHGALVRSNFDGFKSPSPDFHNCSDYWLWLLFLTLALHKYFKKYKKVPKDNLILENHRVQRRKFVQTTRADKSLRSVLSDLGNLEYGINIFKKNEMNIWCFPTQLEELAFYIQLKASSHPQPIPIPTPASAPPPPSLVGHEWSGIGGDIFLSRGEDTLGCGFRKCEVR